MAPRFLLAVLAALALRHPGAAQTCSGSHYRWPEKTELAFAKTAGRRVSIATMLGRWSLPAFTGEAKYACAARDSTHERTVYSVTGWVRRVRKDEDDGDWHIELTSRANGDTARCIVAEVPDSQFGAQYALVRVRLDSMLAGSSVSRKGDVSPPVRVRFIGLAFFDGQHRGGATRRDRTDGAHGRCNSSARALWEIHPVYWVTRP